MSALYTIAIYCYGAIIRMAGMFNTKAKEFVRGRQKIWPQLEHFKAEHQGPVIWFHAASLGEFEQGLPVMQSVRQQFPNHQLVVSFFSPSGFLHRKNHPVASWVCYLPLDTPKNARRFVETLKPEMAVFIKYEFWHVYLKACSEQRVPLVSISALFTPKHIFFKKYGAFYRKMLHRFDHLFVQNQSSLQMLKSIGIDRASVSGDTRFDRVIQTISKPQHYPEIARWTKDYTTLIVGSAWPEDMLVIERFIHDFSGKIKVIIAPHLVEPEALNKITKHLSVDYSLYTDSKNLENTAVLILDTIGMLSSVYQYGHFAYIGGAFGDGLHNILEAVAFGLPVTFGNKGLEKFPESTELIELGGAIAIANEQEAYEALKKLMNKEEREVASTICQNYVLENAGATEKIMRHLKGILQ